MHARSPTRYYAALFRAQLRMSLITALQYRADFFLEGLTALMWMAVTLLPVYVVFGQHGSVAGWSYAQALTVTGMFTVMGAILEGGVNASLTAVVEHIRKGTLDFILLKPADAQFLVSTSRFTPWKVVDFAGGLCILIWSLVLQDRRPGLADLLTALLLSACGVVVLYSIWILVISAAFYVVRMDNLSYLLQSIFDAGRWPITVFRGAWKWLFTFIFPLALITSYPSMALMGTLQADTAVFSVLGSAVFAALARRVWLASLSAYSSASS